MKRVLALFLALLLLMCMNAACADAMQITLTASDYALHYAFDAGTDFILLEYSTPAEKGWMTLYSENGQFEGDISLAYSGAGGKATVTVTSSRTTYQTALRLADGNTD